MTIKVKGKKLETNRVLRELVVKNKFFRELVLIGIDFLSDKNAVVSGFSVDCDRDGSTERLLCHFIRVEHLSSERRLALKTVVGDAIELGEEDCDHDQF